MGEKIRHMDKNISTLIIIMIFSWYIYIVYGIYHVYMCATYFRLANFREMSIRRKSSATLYVIWKNRRRNSMEDSQISHFALL